MKPFLTEEQKKYIYSRLLYRSATCNDKVVFRTQDAEEVLDECVINEFPKFTQTTQCESQICIDKRHAPGPIISINVVNEYAYFTSEEFLQLAGAIAKIKDWLDAS